MADGGSADAWKGFDESVSPDENHYDEICFEMVTDKIFLLDIKQLWNICQNEVILGINYHLAKSTQQAIDHDEYDKYFLGQRASYSVENEKRYWLRTPLGIPYLYVFDAYTNNSRMLLNTANSMFSYHDGIGVRPAFYLDESNAIILSGSGTEDDPYVINGKKDGISVLLNGSELSFDQPPIIENDCTLVPFRVIFEALGAEVSWDNETQTATGILNDTIIQLTIGSETAHVNEQSILLDVPPKIINDRTLVPLRFVAESFGFRVEWDEETQIASINTEASPPIQTGL